MALHNEVFNQQIWQFFCNDLDSCIKVAKIVQKEEGKGTFKGGLNFTAALVIFSVIEFVSGWYQNRESDSNTVAEFLDKYASKYFNPFRDKRISKKFYEVFRNGLSHQWSPKGSGIAMDTENNILLGKQRIGNEDILTLNVPSFYELAKIAIKNYENDLNNNEDLRAKFENRYKKLVESDFKEMRILRNMLEENK